MNPDELKEVQKLQELLTRFNADTSFIIISSVLIVEAGEESTPIRKFKVGDDDETMFFFQTK